MSEKSLENQNPLAEESAATNALPNAAPAEGDPSPRPFVADRGEWWLLFLAPLLGVLAWEWVFRPRGTGFATVLFLLAFYATVFAYGHGDRNFQPKRGLAWGIPPALCAVSCLLFANSSLAFLNCLFLYASAGLHVWTMFGQRSPEIFCDLRASAIGAPFVALDAPFHTLGRASSLGGKSGKFGKILLGLLISVPVLAVVLSLLISADGAFESLLVGIFSRVSEFALRLGGDLLFGGVFLGIFLFSWFYTARRKERCERTEKRELSKRFDSMVIGTVVAMVCAVYLVFLIVQFDYLFSVVWGRLPSDEIYSSYARRGFFEMQWIAGINLLILLAALCSKQRDAWLLKSAGVLLSVLTVLLALSALCKMGMYVQAYGLTPLRVYTSWFLILEITVFVWLTVGMFRVRFPVAKAIVVTGMALYLALNFACVDRMIAKHNTERYFAAPELGCDLGLLYELGEEALPYVEEIRDNTKDPEVRQRAENIRNGLLREQSELDWRSKNFRSLFREGK